MAAQRVAQRYDARKCLFVLVSSIANKGMIICVLFQRTKLALSSNICIISVSSVYLIALKRLAMVLFFRFSFFFRVFSNIAAAFVRA